MALFRDPVWLHTAVFLTLQSRIRTREIQELFCFSHNLFSFFRTFSVFIRLSFVTYFPFPYSIFKGLLPERDWAGDEFEWSKPMAELLQSTFGLKDWRTNQKKIVNATLSGRDVFVVMRTGGGKSLCYQLPALLKGGITVGAFLYVSVVSVMYPWRAVG